MRRSLALPALVACGSPAPPDAVPDDADPAGDTDPSAWCGDAHVVTFQVPTDGPDAVHTVFPLAWPADPATTCVEVRDGDAVYEGVWSGSLDAETSLLERCHDLGARACFAFEVGADAREVRFADGHAAASGAEVTVRYDEPRR